MSTQADVEQRAQAEGGSQDWLSLEDRMLLAEETYETPSEAGTEEEEEHEEAADERQTWWPSWLTFSNWGGLKSPEVPSEAARDFCST